MKTIVKEMIDTTKKSLKELKKQIVEVVIGKPGYFTFWFQGKKHLAPEEDYVIGLNIEADKSIALIMLLDKKTSIVERQ